MAGPSTMHKCYCLKCAGHPDGYEFQSKNLLTKHLKRYGLPTRAVDPDPKAEEQAPQEPRVRAHQEPAPQEPRVRAHQEPAHQEGGTDHDRLEPHGDLDLDFFGDGDFFENDVGPGFPDDDGALGNIDDRSPSPELPHAVPHVPHVPLDRVWRRVELPDVRIPGSDTDEVDRPPVVPPAFAEEPCVRLAYLAAVISNVYDHLSVLQATNGLNATLNSLLIAGKLPEFPRPVRTLESAKRRLGIDPDQHITQYTVCPKCWKHHTPKQMDMLPSPACATRDCTGILYELYTDSHGLRKRRPFKVVPHMSIIQTLRRFFMRPGFAASIRDSRNARPRNFDDEDFVMKDMHDAEGWDKLNTGMFREVGDLGTVRDVPGAPGADTTKLTSHRFGLHLTINTDWLQLLSNRPHSTGPIYISINDLPRDQRFLQINVICPCIMPGPSEPNAQQLNHILEPSTKELSMLQHGVLMEIRDQEPELVYADYICNNCDTPAARKISGTAGHSADFHPCPYCETVLIDINKPQTYEAGGETKKDDYQLLRQAFSAKISSTRRQNKILKDYGVRWSVLNVLANWFPSSKTALDFMHNIFLGLICHFFSQVLFAAHMFSGAGGNNSPKQRFEDLINRVRWPSHITRLPKNMGENQSLKKADEWRRLLTITPVLLWYSWRDVNDSIPNSTPRVSPNEVITTTHSRNRRELYSASLLLCVGVRLLATRTITLSQARLGQEFLVQFCRACLGLGISLVINHHLSTHFFDMIRRFGPIYGWWLFAFERFNGMLEKVNHNGKDGGKMEVTLLRNWAQTQLIYELLLSLPPTAHDLEREMIEQVIECEARKRGTMMTQIAIFRSEAETDSVKLPKRLGKPVSLRNIEPAGAIYALLLAYFQTLWPDLNLVPEFSPIPGRSFVSSQVARSVPYIRKDGIRYGCTANKRTHADSLAFMSTPNEADPRVAIEIQHLFVVQVPNSNQRPHICAVIRRLRGGHNIPPFPWDLYASMLGIQVTYANEFMASEVIAVARIEAPLALIPIRSAAINRDLWTGAEPVDYELDWD
ncbi:hypothetical protein D9615_001059 [Tricholomella constricta]|uniref:Transposase n=1 Tax=Tricholomella constricta TaxID=117010 RepID=A0A8H5HKH7_9AGAR|nr:hypothetical protein D9615_001059 [Tricholomella constricta]